MVAVGSRVFSRGPATNAQLGDAGGQPVELFYLRHSLSSGPVFSSVWGRNNIASIQTVNTGVAGYYAPDGLESANFQSADEVRHDSGNIAEKYPLSLVAFVRPRDATSAHIICSLMDSSSESKRLYIALRGDQAGDPVECFHHNYGGTNTLQPQTTNSLVVDGWHTVAGVFTKSGTTTTATVRVAFPDGTYEEVAASNTSVGAMADHDRLAIGRISKPVPFNTGNLDIAYVGVWKEELTIDNIRFLHRNPSFLKPTPLALRTFSTATVTSLPSPRAQIGTPLASFDRVLQLPWPDWHNTDEHLRQHAEVMEAILEGGLRCVGIVTLDASSLTTVVQERRCGTASVILLSPVTASAGGEVGIWFSAIGTKNASGIPTFTINHGFDTRTDRTFRYFVVGGGGGYV